MIWIAKDGKDMFNLQADARNITKGVESELDMEMRKIGIGITDFTIESFNYPEEIRKMQEKAAGQAMVGDLNKYTQMAAADGMAKGGNNMAGDMMGMQMGMMMGQQMVNNMMNQGMMNSGMQQSGQGQPAGNGTAPKFCPECGTPTNGAKFCGNCGTKLV